MACSKPVVGCKGEGLEDFVEHGVTGVLVEPKSVDSLVEALDFLLSHPDEAKAMGKRAREVVLANYTWEKNAEKTIEVYHEVLR
jgi:glycosyltransferase involved in cell wall biosynthesis